MNAYDMRSDVTVSYHNHLSLSRTFGLRHRRPPVVRPTVGDHPHLDADRALRNPGRGAAHERRPHRRGWPVRARHASPRRPLMPEPGPSWDVVADIQLLLQFHFMQNAFLAGTLVALLAGTAGYFVVLRGQSFAAHMLSQVGFPGAAAGVLVHVSPLLGLIVFCVGAALGIGWAGRDLDAGHRAESAAVGSLLAFSLGLGLLFFRLYAGSAAGIYSFLFGTILGLSDRDVQLTLVVAVLSFAALALIGRP